MLTRSFDADTALEWVADGVWRGFVPASWFVATGPNGGFLAALGTRAMALATERPPRSLTLHYLEAPSEGPVQVACHVERAGRATAFTSLRIEQDGRPVALGLGASAEPRAGQPELDDTAAPAYPPPEECEVVDPERTAVPAFLRNYEMRIAERDRGVVPPTAAAWLRTSAARPLDPVLLAAMTDALIPPIFLRMRERVFVPTIDLTIHWRGELPDGEHPWVLGVFKTRLANGGVCEEDGELWSQDGRLLAQSRQLAIVRTPR